MREIPKKYKAAESEARWQAFWEEQAIHRWDPECDRDETFVIDTPPPTVSGSLHVGHVFSYTHQDLIARYQRMQGKNIAYPMGWDDNGLPTERRVQNVFGIRCEPRLPYDADWKPKRGKGKKDPIEEISRRNFIEACTEITEEDEAVFEQLFRRLGLSIDWSQQYATIDAASRKVSQLSFLDLVRKNEVYSTESPTMWDIDFRTAVAQAEVEDKDRPGFMHVLRFGIGGDLEAGNDDTEFKIMTTRPELLPACIAVVAHPDDKRYQPYFGKTAITPLFGAEVPILPAEHADPEKGTGILMVCTFGDAMDVDWWKQSKLPLKQIIGLTGRLLSVEFGSGNFQSLNSAKAQKHYDEIAGLYPKQAKKRLAEILAEEGSGPKGQGAALVGEPEPITHPVKFYEKGDRPLEFVPTRQWFVKILDKKEELLAQGAKIDWHPPFMRKRFDSWVEGLNQDWCISRQRYFGVPFPVWYEVDDDSQPIYERPIFAEDAILPVDPLSDVPTGFTEDQRDQPGGFSGDPDVMDTWATSSLTPQIMSHWRKDPARHQRLFPMDVRPQSHEIIRTWAFYTIVKAWLHEKEIPWKNVVISGWILDPDRKKMSKSVGNVVTPDHLLDDHSVDGVRYWTARARLGQDTAFDDKVFKVGKKLANKIFNASRFVHTQIESATAGAAVPGNKAITEALDLALVDRLRKTVDSATKAFEAFDYAGALQVSEEAFWSFCDYYLELVKIRSYAEEDSAGRRSALATLQLSLHTYLRLLAPFLPYVTEEVWSWRMAGEGRDASIHTTQWPQSAEFAAIPAPAQATSYAAAVCLTAFIRGAKSEGQKSLRWPVSQISITGKAADIAALEPLLDDVLLAGNASRDIVEITEGDSADGEMFEVKVTLAQEEAD
ncbi:MAG: valine--tRNA ligase [Planctomycetota bacterium]